MDIQTIQRLVLAQRYQVKLHAVQHALQEGFDEQDMVAAILCGRLLETYPERRRGLICGEVVLDADTTIFLHVVCQQDYPDQVDIVTAYIPSTREWETPPFRRKQRNR